jgi:hypothetical protein
MLRTILAAALAAGLLACSSNSATDAGPPDAAGEGLTFRDGRGELGAAPDAPAPDLLIRPDTRPPDPDDRDGDGLSNDEEKLLGTNPNSKDSDGDGVDDKAEVGDPKSPKDSDGDGKIDALEPNDFDSDGDGVPDQQDKDDTDGPCGKTQKLFSSATLAADRTLAKACSPYRVVGHLAMVGGATLSVEAGVTVELAAGAALLLGDGNGKGGLKASGAPTEQVVLTGVGPPKRGAWRGIVVENGKALALAYTKIQGAGAVPSSASEPPAALWIKGALGGVVLDHVTFAQAAGHALHASYELAAGQQLFAIFQSCTFAEVDHAALLHLRHLGEIGAGNDFGAVGSGGEVQVAGTTISVPTVWHSLGVPYVMQETTLEVEEQLTIDAGVTLVLKPGAAIDVGYKNSAGHVLANGKVGLPVTIGTASGTAGSWDGLRLYGNKSTLSYTIIHGAGQSSSAGVEASLYLDQGSNLVATQVTIQSSAGYGVYFYRPGNECNLASPGGFNFVGTFPGSTKFPGCKFYCLDDINGTSGGVCLKQ